mgnify:CR=1 FL=1
MLGTPFGVVCLKRGGEVRRLANGDWFVRGHVSLGDLTDRVDVVPVTVAEHDRLDLSRQDLEPAHVLDDTGRRHARVEEDRLARPGRELDKVTPEDVARVAGDLIDKQGLNLAVIGPFDDPDRFEKLLA